MWTETNLQKLVEKHSPFNSGIQGMILCILKQSIIGEIAEPDLIEKIKSITYEHKASTPSDDDEYWTFHSPFDGKWYTFASTACGGGWPTNPVYVDYLRRGLFDED